MIRKNLLEARMKENNIEYTDLCKLINMSYQSLKWRLWGRTDFKRKEIIAIKNALNLSVEQVVEIFFLETK